MSPDDSVIKSQESLPDGVCVALDGDVDLSRSPTVRQTLINLAHSGNTRIVVDLTDVPYMDSSGVATLVEALQAQRKAGGQMVLFGLQPRVQSIFEIARLNMVFTIVDDREAALHA